MLRVKKGISNVDERLKPCPFCGSSSITHHATTGDDAIECLNCGAFGPWKRDQEEAESGWEQRWQSQVYIAIPCLGGPFHGTVASIKPGLESLALRDYNAPVKYDTPMGDICVYHVKELDIRPGCYIDVAVMTGIPAEEIGKLFDDFVAKRRIKLTLEAPDNG